MNCFVASIDLMQLVVDDKWHQEWANEQNIGLSLCLLCITKAIMMGTP
jgi:hypothetical protein